MAVRFQSYEPAALYTQEYLKGQPKATVQLEGLGKLTKSNDPINA
jgi:hypothetical protein